VAALVGIRHRSGVPGLGRGRSLLLQQLNVLIRPRFLKQNSESWVVMFQKFYFTAYA
jgi:hypothetical protein